MQASVNAFSLDPWSHWQGDAAAFPYGYVMWLWLLPASTLCKLAGWPLLAGYHASLLLADLLLLHALRRLLPGRERLLLCVYWLSPLVIIATYGFGLNDLIPASLLVLAMLACHDLRSRRAGLFCSMAISAKLSMLLALPFFLLYLGGNRALRQLLPAFHHQQWRCCWATRKWPKSINWRWNSGRIPGFIWCRWYIC